MKTEERVKEIYRLWWEYLLCTEEYKALCNGVFSTRTDNISFYFWDFMDLKYHKGNWSFADKKIRTAIKSITFDEWWEYHKNKRDKTVYTGIQNYGDIVEGEVDFWINYFKETEGREPTLHELKKYFVMHIQRDDLALYLKVFPQGQTVEDLKRDLGIIIKKGGKTMPSNHMTWVVRPIINLLISFHMKR